MVALREGGGRTLPFVVKAEAEGVQIAARIAAKATGFYADEAAHWDALHTSFKTYRINHTEAYSDAGVSTNWVESYFSRLRRMIVASITTFRRSTFTSTRTMPLGSKIIAGWTTALSRTARSALRSLRLLVASGQGIGSAKGLAMQR